MRGSAKKLALLLTAVAVALAVTAVGGSSLVHKNARPTLVFGTAADPVVLDGSLVSDGESLRVIDQLFEGLVGLKPGSTVVVPALATSWKASKDGKTWTFNLRHGVKFHDGTSFNSKAVCFNFNRWYNFKGSFQNADASYYWQAVFGGFKHPEAGSPTSSLYRGCRTRGTYKVQLLLTQRSAAFLGALALSNFGIASPRALTKFGANKGTVDSDGVFHPTGTFGTKHPVGTGPFMFNSWKVGEKLTIIRNPHYWGKKAKLGTVIFEPISNNTARLQALQTGEITGYDLVAPEHIDNILQNSGLKLLSRPAFNVGYVGFNLKNPPLNDIKVRQAIAYGLDRTGVVRSFYAGRGQVAKEFMPPQLFGWSPKVKTYTYSPSKAKQLLNSSSCHVPCKIDFWYPTNVSRPYMPDPKKNFEGFSASLENSGFKVVAHSAPWRPDYLSIVDRGAAPVYLVGWTGDYGDPDNFIGTFFRVPNDQFGPIDPKIHAILNRALKETNFKRRVALYQQANEMIMNFLPGVPYVHTKPALAFRKSVNGYRPSPVSLEPFSLVSIGGR